MLKFDLHNDGKFDYAIEFTADDEGSVLSGSDNTTLYYFGSLDGNGTSAARGLGAPAYSDSQTTRKPRHGGRTTVPKTRITPAAFSRPKRQHS